MAKIRVLDAETVGHIAAGEVVERPLSVCKELVENSLDAAATSITVEMAGGGRELLRVVDNGEGMEREDLLLSVERHATSKLAAKEDLFRLGTLGFRGEALASIAAVSRLEIRTRTVATPGGLRMVAEGGVILAVGETGAAPGTVVEIRDLFYNTPVRRAFLRSARTERQNLVEMLSHLSLLNPGVAISLMDEGKVLFSAPGGGDLLAAAMAVFGTEVGKNLRPVLGETEGIKVSGFVVSPTVSRSGRSGQVIGVNGRLVQSYQLRASVENVYAGTLSNDRRPIFCLSLVLPPGEVDVNVHPTKQEVRFANLNQVQGAIYRACREALDQREAKGTFRSGPIYVKDSFQPSFFLREGEDSPPRLLLPGKGCPWRVLGQLQRSYILAEDEANLYVIDQHAAHERVFYEAFLAKDSTAAVQKLLFPLTVELSPAAKGVWENWGEEIAASGFQGEAFGQNTLILRGLPDSLAGLLDETVFLDLLEHLGGEGQGESPAQRRERLCKRMAACKAAVKAREELSLREMEDLLALLHNCQEPYTCPHGRPLLVELPIPELARKMGR